MSPQHEYNGAPGLVTLPSAESDPPGLMPGNSIGLRPSSAEGMASVNHQDLRQSVSVASHGNQGQILFVSMNNG